MSIWPVILFVISLSLFLLVLIPNIFLHTLPIFGEWPRVLECDGSIYIKTNTSGGIRQNALVGATIEIGGYKSITDQKGNFRIRFVTKSPTNIPLIIQWSNNAMIKRISFDCNEFKRTEIFILSE